MSFPVDTAGAVEIAAAVKSREVRATEVVEAALHRMRTHNAALNCFTRIDEERARSEAAAVDRVVASGADPGPLAGVPFGVKNLLDVRGIPTLAGSKIRADAAPAVRDAYAVAALCEAGAVLAGTLNMDEFAYGFTTENTHYGPTRNPHDLSRVPGGSSGGSAAAVAAGLLPLTLGSDTNGSVRVPAAFCGIAGLKPTYGRVSRSGAFLFSSSLDHIGLFTRSIDDLAVGFDALQGLDPDDPVCTMRPAEPCFPELRKGASGLRIAVARGYFEELASSEALDAVAIVARALSVLETVEIPEAARARSAAYVITASEGASHHLADLRSRPEDFDPLTRTRFLAGALVPAAWVNFAQRFRAWYREQVRALFQRVDVILTPVTPVPAIRIGQNTMELGGREMPSRPNIGIFTQPISFIGLPALSVPVHLPGSMPLGVQIIGAPYKEASILRVAWQLQSEGIVAAPIARSFAQAR